MKTKKHISGIFSDLLASCAIWFLYIFVDANANVPSTILSKRKKQIEWLTLIDKINTVYTFNELVNIVQNGIQQKYGVSPANLLSSIYAQATAPHVGSTIEELTASAQAGANQIAVQNLQLSTSGGKKNIWSEVGSVISALISLLQGLNIIKTQSEITSYTPTATDWNIKTSTTSASMGTIVPVLATGVVVYYLFTAKGDNKKNK